MGVLLDEICKRYPGAVAADRVSLEIRDGEIHCLLGENGAGKSTLVGVLGGLVRPESGTVTCAGTEVELATPRASLDLGIAVVRQHSQLIPQLTVLENIVLGAVADTRYDTRVIRRRVETLLESLAVGIRPDTPVSRLSLAEQQRVELARALWRSPRVLVLDEPSALLGPGDAGRLHDAVRSLRSTGLAILYVTHRLAEAITLADRVTILRRGSVVERIPGADLRAAEPAAAERRLVAAMFEGGDPRAHGRGRSAAQDHAPPAEERNRIALEVRGLATEGGRSLREVSFSVAAGEILGVAGIAGSGQRELARALAGEQRSRGRIELHGVPVDHLRARRRYQLGLRHVPDDRVHEGTVAGLSVALNLALRRIGTPPLWRRGVVRPAAVGRSAMELIRRFDVRTASVEAPAGTLSGGNLQKLVLARELDQGARVVIFHEPTQGLDRRSGDAVHEEIRRLASAGGAAVIISTDLDELLDLCDRVVVLTRGTIVGEVQPGPGAAATLGLLMTAGEAAAA